MRQVTERGMLVEQRSSMFSAARGVASGVRRCTAAWGCARLAIECRSQPQLSYRAIPHSRPVNQQRTSYAHERKGLTTFAATSTRETPVLFDPGDYEAGQIQVGAEALRFTLASPTWSRSTSALCLVINC